MEDYLNSGFVLYDDPDYEDHLRQEERDSRIVSYDDGDEPMPHELEYEYEYEYDYHTNEEESLGNVYTYCLCPTLSDAVGYVLPLIVASVLFKTVAQSSYTPRQAFHGVSTLVGIYVVQRYTAECSYVLITLVAASYLILCLPVHCRRGPVVGFLCLCLMLYGERWMEPSAWHKVRGVAMIAFMKVVAVAAEADSSPLLGPLEYTGYILCPATCLFGPWVSYKEYATLHRANPWSLRRIFLAVGYLLAALFFLSISNCWVQWILPDAGWKWAVAYREALSFRASHYFISYASGSMALLGGFSSSAATVVKPWSIEAPRSLVQVVVHWNIPMHTWLKTYVFRQSRVRLGKFGALLLTYAASSLLHGLNFQLAAVLLSLGFYTYVEFQLRQELANIFDACITAKRCGDQKCTHKRTANNCQWVIPINLLFSGLAIFHLAYLGLMFDTSEQQETGYSYAHAVEKWSSLGFASHWVILATYLAYFMIKCIQTMVKKTGGPKQRPMPHELEYEYEYEYDYHTNEEESLGNVYTYCLCPTLSDAVGYVLPLIVASVLFKTVAQSSYTPRQAFHGVSTLVGIYVVQRYTAECSYVLITLVAASYLILCLPVHCRRGPVVGFLCLCLMLYGERWMEPSAWHKVRGVAMIAFMKVVAVAAEADSSPLLGPLEYTGYILCPATCLFGPWVSYKEYATLHRANPWSLRRIFLAVGYLLAALFFLSISNCWVQWILPDAGWKWAVAYREALSFRASHYFISYASGSMALLGGFSSSAATVVKPWSIEAPRSLVQVVVHWNISM